MLVRECVCERESVREKECERKRVCEKESASESVDDSVRERTKIDCERESV